MNNEKTPQPYDLLTQNEPTLQVKTGLYADEISGPHFLAMYNSTVTNQIATIGRGETPSSVDSITHTATIKEMV